MGEREREREGEASTSSPVGAVPTSEGGGYESRLMQLERQLSQLLQKTKVSHSVGLLEPHHVLYTHTHTGSQEDTTHTPTLFWSVK